ncbi:MAG: FtsW/RodA/SpoVE family cell cycle protein [Lachnospiraceae bacterium]|nr:FtsW/RodA/SpoVE family cell cycle protein [Lachnospiraceae bacterium]
MLAYLTALSKYFILILMVFYTIEALTVVFFKRKSNAVFIRQEIYLFFIQFFAYATICLKSGKIDYLFFYAILQLVIFSAIVLYQTIYPGIDKGLLNNLTLLLSLGFIILTRLDFSKAVKQLIIASVSLTLSFFVPTLIRHLSLLRRLKWLYVSLGLACLSVVLILGQVTNGSKIFYTVAGITIQPSEFVKVIFVFAVAALLYHKKRFSTYVVSAVIAALHVLILVASRDLGSALIFFVTYMAMLFVASKNYLYLAMGMLAGSGAAYAAGKLFTHVQVRVQAFLDPFSVIDKEGFQITQSLFAVACGGFWGTGLMKGVPEDIPYVESDFIFSAIAEEMGVIVAVCMLLVCVFCFLTFMKTAMVIRDSYYRLVAVGFGVMYIFQVFLTVGGGIKFIPLTGVTLPLVSYGGSSVLVSIVIFAIVQGIILRAKDEADNEAEDEEEDLYEDEEE